MMPWIVEHAYLSRPICIAAIESFEAATDLRGVERTVLLLVDPGGAAIATNPTDFLRTLIAANPLAIGMCGRSARRLFDETLDLLADGVDRPHIMTYPFREDPLDEAIDGFLCACLPAVERWDDWASYSILVVGPEFLPTVRAIVAARCT